MLGKTTIPAPELSTASATPPAEAFVGVKHAPLARDRQSDTHAAPAQRLGTCGTWPMCATLLAADCTTALVAIGTTLGGVALFSGAVEFQVVAAAFAWAALWLATFALAGLYTTFPIHPVVELRRASLATGGVTISLLAAYLLAGNLHLAGLAMLVSIGCGSLLLVPLMRAGARSLGAKSRYWGRRVIIFGGTAEGVEIHRWLTRHPQWGLRSLGVFEDEEALDDSLDNGDYLGPPELAAAFAREHNVTLAILACSEWHSIDTREFLYEHGVGIREWIVAPSLTGVPSLWGDSCDLAGRAALRIDDRLQSLVSRGIKRTFDLVLTTLLGLAALPLFAALALVVRLSSPGSVFYSQERIGRHGRRFRAWKFRSMLPHADQVLAEYLAAHPELRAEWEANHKLKNDPRITRIGNWLRKTSLDELPQIWNVLRGDMSLVGPRPIVAEEIEKYGADYEAFMRATPGITGLWQVSGRNNTTYPERVAFDAYYVRNWSLWLDIYILACTVRTVLLREGAY